MSKALADHEGSISTKRKENLRLADGIVSLATTKGPKTMSHSVIY